MSGGNRQGFAVENSLGFFVGEALDHCRYNNARRYYRQIDNDGVITFEVAGTNANRAGLRLT